MKRGLLMMVCGWLAVAALGCGSDNKVTIPTKNYPPPSGEESESTGGTGKVKAKGENAKEG